MIYNVHENKSAEKGIPKPDQRGNYLNSKPKVTAQQKERVLEHIKSFPTVDAHSHALQHGNLVSWYYMQKS